MTYQRSHLSVTALVVTCCLLAMSAIAFAQSREHGVIKETQEGKILAWNAEQSKWTTPTLFWLHFAKTNDGKFWGDTDTYPKYETVNEYDTLLIRLEQGPCLMQFFHERWRRANDVQRWDEAFNEYGGCPFVFD